MRYACKTDSNHKYLRDEVFRKLCPFVKDTSSGGKNCGDLMIRTRRGSFYLVEIKKDEKAPLTASQIEMLREFPSVFRVVRTQAEAEELCKL